MTAPASRHSGESAGQAIAEGVDVLTDQGDRLAALYDDGVVPPTQDLCAPAPWLSNRCVRLQMRRSVRSVTAMATWPTKRRLAAAGTCRCDGRPAAPPDGAQNPCKGCDRFRETVSLQVRMEAVQLPGRNGVGVTSP